MARKSEIDRIVEGLEPELNAMAKNLIRDVYGPEGMPWGTRFSELEDVSVSVSQCLARRMMENAATDQAGAYDSAPEQYHVCPGCGECVELPKRSREQQGGDSPPDPEAGRDLDTRVGPVHWSEPERYCTRCRRAFFPSGDEFRP